MHNCSYELKEYLSQLIKNHLTDTWKEADYG